MIIFPVREHEMTVISLNYNVRTGLGFWFGNFEIEIAEIIVLLPVFIFFVPIGIIIIFREIANFVTFQRFCGLKIV